MKGGASAPPFYIQFLLFVNYQWIGAKAYRSDSITKIIVSQRTGGSR